MMRVPVRIGAHRDKPRGSATNVGLLLFGRSGIVSIVIATCWAGQQRQAAHLGAFCTAAAVLSAASVPPRSPLTGIVKGTVESTLCSARGVAEAPQ